jgi:hypothetical protein
VSWALGRPLLVVMACAGSDPERPCALVACLNPLRADAGSDFASLTVRVNVQAAGEDVFIIEAPSWAEARAELARLLRACRMPGTAEHDVPGSRRCDRGVVEELPPHGREHYRGDYGSVPHLTPQEALEMIDAAIEAAGEPR